MMRDSIGVVHSSLRAATRSDHTTIDRMISELDLTCVHDYGRFLQIHHSALQELKSDWRQCDFDDFLSMTRCLEEDLQALGINQPSTLQVTPRASLSDASRLGVAYVIRGSRLGSSFLRRRVSPEFAATYLDFSPALSWSGFLRQLEEVAGSSGGELSKDVAHGARVTFAIFADSITRMLAEAA